MQVIVLQVSVADVWCPEEAGLPNWGHWTFFQGKKIVLKGAVSSFNDC